MAHFAEINEKNFVIRILVVPDSEQHRGQEYLAEDLNLGGVWIQTSYNTHGNVHKNGGEPLHMNFAGIGFTWDGVGFIPIKPYESWIFDNNYVWQSPVERTEFDTIWDEEQQEWVKQ